MIFERSDLGKGLLRNHLRLSSGFCQIFMAKFMLHPFCESKHAAVVRIVLIAQKLIVLRLCQQFAMTFRNCLSLTLTGISEGVRQKRLVSDIAQTLQSRFHLPLIVASH